MQLSVLQVLGLKNSYEAASSEIVKTALEVNHMTIEIHDCENIFDFYNYALYMRAQFPVSRSSVNDDLIRAQTLIRTIHR